jgi:hypothetical protein
MTKAVIAMLLPWNLFISGDAASAFFLNFVLSDLEHLFHSYCYKFYLQEKHGFCLVWHYYSEPYDCSYNSVAKDGSPFLACWVLVLALQIDKILLYIIPNKPSCKIRSESLTFFSPIVIWTMFEPTGVNNQAQSLLADHQPRSTTAFLSVAWTCYRNWPFLPFRFFTDAPGTIRWTWKFGTQTTYKRQVGLWCYRIKVRSTRPTIYIHTRTDKMVWVYTPSITNLGHLCKLYSWCSSL